MGIITSCLSRQKETNIATDATLKTNNLQTNEICETSKINADDLSFIDEKNKTLIKKQGSIQMNSFLIDACENCQIFILDTTAQITIDFCTDCIIFLSPCGGSVFIRNSENCQIVSICSQIRLRECINLEIMLFCASDPCIETSTNIKFYCHQFAYFGLLQQMDAAMLCIFDNLWFNVRDFGVDERSEFKIKHDLKATFDFLYDLPQNVYDELQPIKQRIIPLTVGSGLSEISAAKESYEECIAFVIANNQDCIIESFRILEKRIANDANAYFIQMKTMSNDHSVMRDKLLLNEDDESIYICINVYLSPQIKHGIQEFSSKKCRFVVFDASELRDPLFGNAINFDSK